MKNISLIFIFLPIILASVADYSLESDEVPPPATATSTVSPIEFSIEGPSSVQLPVESVTFRVVFKDPIWSAQQGNWTFYWFALDGVGNGYAEAYDNPILELTKLKPGKLRYQVTVKTGLISGEKQKDLEILAVKTENLKPHAVIKPASPIYIDEHSQLVLEGEGSRDDDGKIVTYEWHLKKGPSVQLPSALNTPILTLNNLQPGNYTFSLKVTDDAGASDEIEVDVFVSEERDDPPKAHISRCGDSATGSITVRLPLDELNLCGNSSTDDIKIEQYSWARVDNLSNLPVDYTGSSTSILKLTNIPPNELSGPYIFQLEVVDGKGQKDSTKISIFVNKAENQPPKVNAGKNATITLPESSAILDGAVEDDGTIVEYKWQQLDGPSQSSILNGDKSKATATELQEGIYKFEFIVIDDGGLNSSSVVFINVERSHNQPPIALAKNVTVTLPRTIVALNGSLSTDDAGIVEYKWTPYDNVPACISPLDNSETQPVLFLNGLVEGEFLFNLTVFDQQKASDTVTITLTVKNGDERLNSVEIYMDQKIEDITYRLRRKFEGRLSAALTAQISEASTVFVHFTDFGQDPKTGNLRVVFHAEYSLEDLTARQARDLMPPAKLEVVDVRRAVKILQKENVMIQEFSIKQIESLYCQRSCSHHGRCNNFTKECVCESYWMGSLFTILSTGKQLDCSWSKLYFVIIICTVFSITLIIMGCSAALRRKFRRYPICNRLIPCLRDAKDRFKRKRFRRKKRYERLDSDSNKAVINMMSSTSLNSESEDES
uniref:PKD domain-containing protein n=1 Tax=Panagrolaimus sp. ES5 TaxID=591445 RepID=A0AC34F6U3_9BILA